MKKQTREFILTLLVMTAIYALFPLALHQGGWL